MLSIQGSGIVGVAGISARLFGALASVKINVMLITQGSSEHIISFAVRPQDAALGGRQLGRQPAAHHLLIIRTIQSLLDGDLYPIRKVMFLMPPGAAKSTYTSQLLPPWPDGADARGRRVRGVGRGR